MKRLVTAMTALALSAHAAGTMFDKPKEPVKPGPKPIEVYLSAPKHSFEIDFDALYIQPTASNLDFAAEADPFTFGQPQPEVSPNWIIHQINPSYCFGFNLGIAGVFHGSNSTLMANWERVHTGTSHKSVQVPSDDMIGPFFEIGPDAGLYKESKGSVWFHFDEANLDYGTYVQLGDRLKTNLFAGGSFVRIHEHRHTAYTNFGTDPYRTITVPSTFIGGGPQVGVDFAYKIAGGFKFIGDTRATLYVGNISFKTTYSTTSTELTDAGDFNPNVQSTKDDGRVGLVPGFETKLGFAYDWQFKCHYMVKLQLGYQAQIYLNALRSIDMGSEVDLPAVGSVGTGATGVYARTFERVISDFALAGPFATLDLGF